MPPVAPGCQWIPWGKFGQIKSKNPAKLLGYGYYWILIWWRRGESNPRPKGFSQRRLHAYLLI